ncbi:MAG TPA: hypothetical protein VF274_02920 [Alphaproteobacteria bacterium]|jgi:hypothetical protein
MTRDELISKLHDARALVFQAYEGTDLPQIQMILRHADQNLHWALWNLGVIDSLRPDLPERPARTASAGKKAVRKKPARAAAKRTGPAKTTKATARRAKATMPKRGTAGRRRAKRGAAGRGTARRR